MCWSIFFLFCCLLFFFFFNDTATTEIYTLSLHDALPIITCTGVAGVFVTASSSQAPPPHLQLEPVQTSSPFTPLLTDPRLRAEYWFSRRGLQFGVPHGAYGA